MLRNKLSNRLLIISFLLSFSMRAQFYDIYQNQSYEISNRVLKHLSDKEHHPGEIEILQHKNQDENSQWKKIEEDLYRLAIQKIDSEFEYFKILNRLKTRSENAGELLRLRNREEPGKAKLDRITIELISLSNGFGVYSINFQYELPTQRNDFLALPISNYFLADYKSGKLTEIGGNPDSKQQIELKKLSSAELKKLYLLQTKKLFPNEVERIQNLIFDPKDDSDFLTKIDFSEAIVFPYFNGLRIEFPKYSNSSKMFDGKSFRIVLNEMETKELLKVYPEFKKVFAKELKIPSQENIEKLNNDNNFDLSKFSSAPKELELLGILNPNSELKMMKIETYRNQSSSNELMNTKYFYFNDFKKLDSIIIKNEREETLFSEAYFYDKNNELTAIYNPKDETKLRLFSNKGSNGNKEKIKMYEYRDALSNQYLELSVIREITVFNDLYRYSQEIELVGEPKYENKTYVRFLDNHSYCTEYLCVLYDEKGRLIGVKTNKYQTIDVLVNENNQPLEAYFDNDRDKCFFIYDEKGRIEKFQPISSNRSSVVYEYHEDSNHPLTIFESNPELKH